MDNSKINKAADILYNSRINLKKIKLLPEECIPKSPAEAYVIQNEVAKRYIKKINLLNTFLKLLQNIKLSLM